MYTAGAASESGSVTLTAVIALEIVVDDEMLEVVCNESSEGRRHWVGEVAQIGDVITIRGFAARDGTRAGNAAAVIRTNTGEALYASSGDGSAE